MAPLVLRFAQGSNPHGDENVARGVAGPLGTVRSVRIIATTEPLRCAQQLYNIDAAPDTYFSINSVVSRNPEN